MRRRKRPKNCQVTQPKKDHPDHTYLPALRALLGEGREGDGFIGVLLAVLLPACLNEVRIGRHTPARLVGLGARHLGVLKTKKKTVNWATSPRTSKGIFQDRFNSVRMSGT